ncbi:MAG: PPC domain-containing protein [Verrucomicrobia bacterium]|nr:PPC domain-containing protein [Verrucomicrobiota bacterium]
MPAPAAFRRSAFRPAALLAVALGLLPGFAAGQTAGQRTTPNLGYVYPAGGQRGTTVTVYVGGERLNGASAAYLSVPGAQVRVIGHDRPLSVRESQDAREKLQELQQKRTSARAAEKSGKAKGPAAEEAAPAEKKAAPAPVWTDDDEKTVQRLRTLLAKRPVRLATPALAETVTLEVFLPRDARAGEQELRILTPAGLSNPMVFQVGDLPENVDQAITCSVTPPSLPASREANLPNPAKKSARQVTLPTVVNGQIMPGEVDRIRFTAKQGQRLTLAVYARALIPYLADAVPGWFQATLALYDPQGREVAYEDDYRFNPDPVLAYNIAADGDYTIEIKDSIFRGREDFVYRLAIGELPYLTGIFPLGSAPQAQTTFDLAGWNLPSEKLTIPSDKHAPGTFLLAVRNQGHLSNPVRFAIDQLPETIETTQPNDTREQAQAISLPAVINGRIERRGDQDLYAFDARAGDTVIAEVFARRLQSPLDSVLELTDANGQRLAFNDDNEDKGFGLITHHADSRLAVKIASEGRYFLRLADTQHRGGNDFAYRLRVGPPQPDFELRVVPSTINVRASANTPITVYALRRDGFDGEIALGLPDAPRGFFLSGNRIPPGQDKVCLTLTAPPALLDQPMNLRVVGQAKVNDRVLTHTAVPADDLMQAFFYRHLVIAKELKVCTVGRGSPSRILGNLPLRLNAGGEARIQVASAVARNVNDIRVEIIDPPEGITVKRTRVNRDGFEVVFACDAAKAKPGLQGNLVLNVFAERGPTKGSKQKQGQRSALGTAPAIPFEVVAAPAKRST